MAELFRVMPHHVTLHWRHTQRTVLYWIQPL